MGESVLNLLPDLRLRAAALRTALHRPRIAHTLARTYAMLNLPYPVFG